MDTFIKNAKNPGEDDELPLAVGYVNIQGPGRKRYDDMQALSQGTSFPALNYPYANKAAGPVEPDDLTGLMALDFALHELVLYLDTHPGDEGAVALHGEYSAKLAGARRAYEDKYGPLSAATPSKGTYFTWVSNPWPWDGQGK